MSETQAPTRLPWRTQVKQWLASVQNHRNAFVVDIKAAAEQNRGSFPRNLWLLLIGHLIRGLAVWLIKSALKDAADDLGVPLTADELDFIASVATDALLGP